MTVDLTPISLQQISKLQQKHPLSEAQLIEQALLLMGQDDADWDAIFEDDTNQRHLSEEEAFELAVSEVRTYRNSKK